MKPFLTCLLFLCVPLAARAQDPTYWQDIRPIFRKHCTVCHSVRNLKEIDVSGGLALDTFAGVKKGSERTVVKAGQSDESLLYKLIIHKDAKRRMPLDAKPLAGPEIALIKKWIDTGAKEGKESDGGGEPVIVKKSGKLRRLDVVLPTAAVPPAALLPKAKPGKLEIALKVGPLSPITAVAFSPDGKTLAAGSYGLVTVWDLEKAQPAKLLTNVLGAVNDLRFNPAGTILAVAGGQPSAKGDLRLYQTSDWKLLATMRGHDDVIFSVAWSNDGTRLATASFDHKVKVWDAATHAELQTYTGHSDFVYAVAFSPDGKKLASASKDRTVQLIDLASGRSQFTFSGMEQDVLAVAFHPDGKSVVSSGFETAIFWWNPLNGEKVKTQGGHGIAVHELAFSKDGSRLVSAGADRTARVWDGKSGAPLKSMAVGSVVYAVAISPNNALVASGSFDGLVRLWEEKTGRHLATFVALHGDKGEDQWLALTPEGYAAAADSLFSEARWRMIGAEVDGAPLWKALRRPELVARSLGGETLPAAFAAPKK
ncbi:MAG: c-type cytochrome domain-containing protein [Gemmataceae bacterium]